MEPRAACVGSGDEGVEGRALQAYKSKTRECVEKVASTHRRRRSGAFMIFILDGGGGIPCFFFSERE